MHWFFWRFILTRWFFFVGEGIYLVSYFIVFWKKLIVFAHLQVMSHDFYDMFSLWGGTIDCTESKSIIIGSKYLVLFFIDLIHVILHTSTIHFITTNTSLTYHFVLVFDQRRSDCFARQSHPDSEFSFPLPGPGVSLPPLLSPGWLLIPYLVRQMRAEADTSSQLCRLPVEPLARLDCFIFKVIGSPAPVLVFWVSMPAGMLSMYFESPVAAPTFSEVT